MQDTQKEHYCGLDYEYTRLGGELDQWKARKRECLLNIGDVLCGDADWSLGTLYTIRDSCIENIISIEIKRSHLKEIGAVDVIESEQDPDENEDECCRSCGYDHNCNRCLMI